MDLFIQIRDGQPYEHPIMGDNFRQAFPHIDVDNLPSEFARFERVACTQCVGHYEVAENSYQWVDGIVKDVWTIRPMTPEEKAAKTQWLVEQVNVVLRGLKQRAQEEIAAAQSDEIRAVWAEHLATVESFTFDDPLTVRFPKLPRFDENGNPVVNTASGSAPDVTG